MLPVHPPTRPTPPTTSARAGAVARGLVLAAGAGTRYGGPKALARGADGVPWVESVVLALREGGCEDVLVVLGAGASRARALVPRDMQVVEAAHWARGLSHSLAAGLERVSTDAGRGGGADALVVVTVDVPRLPAAAVARVLAAAGATEPRRGAALVRATYGGRPGHPVLLGADHWDRLRALLSRAAAEGSLEDVGAGPHLAALASAAGTAVTSVACDDLWDGLDVDAPS